MIKRYFLFTVNFYFATNPPYIHSSIEDFFPFLHSRVFDGLIVNGVVVFSVYGFMVKNLKINKAHKR